MVRLRMRGWGVMTGRERRSRWGQAREWKSEAGLYSHPLHLFSWQGGKTALDLAKGGLQTTQYPINRLPRTLLYRNLRSRDHQIPPRPRALN